MKEKPEICPVCKGRLFLTNRDGTKTCASCGHTLGTPSAHGGRSAAAPVRPSPSKTEKCPSCGSVANYVSTDADGKEIYACSFCGSKFTPKPRVEAKPKEPEPEKPAAPIKDELDGREIFALAKANTVEIFCRSGSGASAGSGFFIADNFVMTNAHVVFDDFGGANPTPSSYIAVCFKGGKQHGAEILAANLDEDMAILATDLSCSAIAEIAKEMPETGETIYAVGNSAGQGMCIMEGLVADQLREIADNDYMMISANIVGGNSGGPIFNKHGKVVGIVTLGSNEAVAMNYGIPVPRIERFIKSVEQKVGKKFARK